MFDLNKTQLELYCLLFEYKVILEGSSRQPAIGIGPLDFQCTVSQNAASPGVTLHLRCSEAEWELIELVMETLGVSPTAESTLGLILRSHIPSGTGQHTNSTEPCYSD